MTSTNGFNFQYIIGACNPGTIHATLFLHGMKPLAVAPRTIMKLQEFITEERSLQQSNWWSEFPRRKLQSYSRHLILFDI